MLLLWLLLSTAVFFFLCVFQSLWTLFVIATQLAIFSKRKTKYFQNSSPNFHFSKLYLRRKRTRVTQLLFCCKLQIQSFFRLVFVSSVCVLSVEISCLCSHKYTHTLTHAHHIHIYRRKCPAICSMMIFSKTNNLNSIQNRLTIHSTGTMRNSKRILLWLKKYFSFFSDLWWHWLLVDSYLYLLWYAYEYARVNHIEAIAVIDAVKQLYRHRRLAHVNILFYYTKLK